MAAKKAKRKSSSKKKMGSKKPRGQVLASKRTAIYQRQAEPASAAPGEWDTFGDEAGSPAESRGGRITPDRPTMLGTKRGK